MPYKSVRFDINTAKQLRAYKINKAFIEDYLIPKASNGEIYIVFSWGANQFRVPESENIYILPSRHAQGLTFNPEAKEVEIGRRIFEFIKKNNL